MTAGQQAVSEYVVNFELILEDWANRDRAVQLICKRLPRFRNVKCATVTERSQSDPFAAASGISVAIVMVKEPYDAVHAMAKLIHAVRALVEEIKGVSQLRVAKGHELVNAATVEPKDVVRIANAARV